jgi:hypothetical protein
LDILSSERPFPVSYFFGIDPELVSVVFPCYLPIQQCFACGGGRNVKPRNSVDCIDCETEAIGLVLNCQFQRRVDVSLFLVAANVNVMLARTTIS